MDIIATIGPTLETFDDISKAISKGVNTFRIGLGYRSRDTVSLIKTIREVEKSINFKIFIMVDLASSRPRISNHIQIDIQKDDSNSGLIYYIPDRLDVGSYNITITANDETYTVSKKFHLTIQ